MVPCVRNATGGNAYGSSSQDWMEAEVAAATFADARLHRRFMGRRCRSCSAPPEPFIGAGRAIRHSARPPKNFIAAQSWRGQCQHAGRRHALARLSHDSRLTLCHRSRARVEGRRHRGPQGQMRLDLRPGRVRSGGAATLAAVAHAPNAASQTQRNRHPITCPLAASSAQAIESKRVMGAVLSCLLLHQSAPEIRR